MTDDVADAPAPTLDGVQVRDVEVFLQDLAYVAASAVAAQGASVSCGITIQMDDRETTVACSDDWASQLDELQYEVDIGPCLHSLRTDTVVRIDDVESYNIWPEWRERALKAGVGCTLAVPVPLTRGPRGALNFYSAEPNSFGPEAETRAKEMAGRAARAIGLVTSLVDAERDTEQLRAALGGRSIIDQALGVIMGQNRCDADEAFMIIRKASHNRNVKLRQVAAEIVTTVTGKPPVQPPTFRPARRV